MNERKGPGRLPTVGGEARPKVVYVRLTKPQREAAETAARRAGMRLAEWVARLVIAAAPPAR
jgi:hypothetical protein